MADSPSPSGRVPNHQGNVNFLSCDSAFVDMANEKGKSGLPILSDHFQTDRLPRFVRKPPPAPFPLSLCGIRVQSVSMVGAGIFTLIVILISIFVIVWMNKNWDHLENPTKSIVFLSLAMGAIILSGIAFIGGTLATRHRLMIPFLFVSFICLFAQIGSIVVLLITLYSESQEQQMSVAYCVITRVIPTLLVILQGYFIVCHIRSYIDCRRTQREERQ